MKRFVFIFVVLIFLSTFAHGQVEDEGELPGKKLQQINCELTILMTILMTVPSQSARCLLPKYPKDQTRYCKANFPMFYYNAAEKICEQFIFGGCGGTENRFSTFEECETVCGGKKGKNGAASE